MLRAVELRCCLLLILILICTGCGTPPPGIRLVSTTTTESSGLLDHILPEFEAVTGLRVYVVSMGTGHALRAARQGNADLLIVHDPQAEAEFMQQGWGLTRRHLMHNRFVLVGPASDPASVAGTADVVEAMRRLATTETAVFVSRADDSGTHKRERQAWQWAGIDPAELGGLRYREAGAGMGKTLNIAATINAYTLVDIGTWLNFGNRQQLALLLDSDARLHNPYSVIRIHPQRHPHLDHKGAARLAEWLLGPRGQALIRDYRVQGEPAFMVSGQPA